MSWQDCPECGSPETHLVGDLVFCVSERCPLYQTGHGSKYDPWEIKPEAKPFANSEGTIDSLFLGYLKPEKYLTSRASLRRLKEAVKTIEDFAKAMDMAGKVEEM